jgi:putative spermidine/putrescine transport system permease protein
MIGMKLKIFTICVMMFLIMPVFIIIPMSFSSSQYLTFPPPGFSLQWYRNFFSNDQWTDALLQSLKIGMLTTLLSLTLGIMAAKGILKSNFRGKAFLNEVFMMPMIVPTIIVAIAIYRFESTFSLTGTTVGLVCAHTVLAIPFVITTVMSRLSSLDPNLENAAMTLGANRLQTFFRITVPIIKPAIFSATMFSFATSFDEIVVTLFICGVDTTTLPKQIWDGVRTQLDPTITAISSILIMCVVAIMLSPNVKAFFKKDKSVQQEALPEEK